MIAIRRKLVAAVLSMAVAVALMVSATMAWFTISTAPEIGGMHVSLFTERTLLLSSDGTNYAQYIDLSSQFQHLVPLRPVSTADGQNWFLPAYNSKSGALRDVSEFTLDSTLAYANVSDLAVDQNGNVITGAGGNPVQLEGFELRDREAAGYYVYGEFWIKTEAENGARVRLSVPSALTDQDVESGVYGTYVLSGPVLGTNSNGNPVARGDGNNAEAAMRVGFLVNPTQKAQTTSRAGGNTAMIADPDYNAAYEGDAFYIYEPNADLRSAEGKPLADDDGEVDYIKGYQFNSASYVNGNYFATQPIGITNGGSYAPVDPDYGHLLIQKASRWNSTTAVQKLQNHQPVDSSDVQFPMGGFLNSTQVSAALGDDVNGGLNIDNPDRVANVRNMATDIAGSSVIVTLQYDVPVKVRLFVWIEGQDVDCWNDIAAGAFRVNLELAAETIVEPAGG